MKREEADHFVAKFVALLNSHDLEGLVALYGDNPVEHSPVLGDIRGIDQVRHAWTEIFARYPDVRMELDQVLIFEGNRIALFGTTKATDHSGWFGQPPTHQPFAYRAVTLIDLVDGKIVRSERIYDLSAVLRNFEKVHVDNELALAAEVQRALLSRTETATKFCDAAGDSLPCRSIGGDFFQFIPLINGDFAIVLGDVSGKGPAAALLAATIQGMIAIESQSGRTPAQVLANLNRALLRLNLHPRFATLLYGVLSADGSFTYANAAQNPPLLFRDGEATALTNGGTLLGAFPDFDFPQETVVLKEGDAIAVFSDGITEAENSQGEAFGEPRLEQAIAEKQDSNASAMLRSVFRSVKDFSDSATFDDDLTVAVVKYGHEQQL